MMKPGKDSLELGIVVGDINASLKFYKDTLGLEFVGLTPVWFGTSDFKMIEPAKDKVPPRGAVGLEAQLGFRYVTFVVKILSELCQELKAKAVEFTLPEKEIRPGTRIAMVKDPDGNIVEFVERG